MKALVLKEYGRFACEHVAVPVVGEADVLVAVEACGICGSDVHGMDGSTGRRRPPLIMGHEGAGVVAETGRAAGAEVSDPAASGLAPAWKAGDRVTFDSTVWCGDCWFCRRGAVNLCDHRQVLGVACEEFRRDGAMAEYVAVPARTLCRVPEGVPFEHAAMVEPLSVAAHAVARASPTGEDAAGVVGAGMIGLLVVQVLRASGCGTVLAVDLAPDRLALAGRLGADAALNADECDVPDEVRRRTGGRGADVVFEVAGTPSAFGTAVRSARKGATVVLVGNVSPSVELPLQAAVAGEVSLLGSCASAGEYPACLEMIASGQVDVRPLISAVAPLGEGAAWFDRLYHDPGRWLKVILRP